MRRLRTALGVSALALNGLLPGSGGAARQGWSLRPSPNATGSSGSYLESVSCPRTGWCAAVGGTGRHSLAEQWNGAHWSIVRSPSVAGAKSDTLLGSVSCVSARWCAAVGYSVVTTEHGVAVATLAEAWNGTSWVIQRMPVVGGAGSEASLASVACVAPDSCEAVGALTGGGVDAQTRPLAEHWNGSAWSVQTTPNPHAENGSSLAGLSCTAADACTAGGEYDYADVGQSIFAFRWDGRTWSQESQPNPQGQSFNTEVSVSCTTSAVCTSVGTWSNDAGDVVTLAEARRGGTWVRQATPNPAGAELTQLDGVSCVAASRCTAVGESADNGNGVPSSTLAQGWNGTAWTAQATPDPKGSEASELDGVSCATPTTCMAVGSTYDGHTTRTLTESYTR